MSRKWTYEIGCGYESILRDGVMVNKEQAVRALKNYESRIAELEAEVTKCHEFQDSYCDHIAELEAAQRWIPVSERLPELGSPILFYDSILERINKGTCTAKNSDNTNLHWFTDDDLFYFGDRSEYITHWMPLPNPPEVK
jgi:hypothetical protein